MLLSAVFLTGDNQVAAQKKEQVPTIEKIMEEVFKTKGLHKTIGKALEETDIKWNDISPMSKRYAELTASLPKNKCPKGDAKSWAKLSKQCADDAKALETAVSKKDKSATITAWSKLNKGCQACHDEHR